MKRVRHRVRHRLSHRLRHRLSHRLRHRLRHRLSHRMDLCRFNSSEYLGPVCLLLQFLYPVSSWWLAIVIVQ